MKHIVFLVIGLLLDTRNLHKFSALFLTLFIQHFKIKLHYFST